MEEILEYVGARIRYFRKRKGYTIQDLAQAINKGKAVVSKYERGIINLDIITLHEIATALDINLNLLIDYQGSQTGHSCKNRQIRFANEKSEFYTYYFDGRKNRCVIGVVQLTGGECDGPEVYEARFYLGINPGENYSDCEHFYTGRLYQFDSIAYYSFLNTVNPLENISFYLMQPFHNKTYTRGLLLGLSSCPFNPVAIKIIAMAHLAENMEELAQELRFSKEDIKDIKYNNMLTCTTTIHNQNI